MNAKGNSGRAGAALVTVMLTVTMVMIASGVVATMAAFMPRIVRRQSDFIRAKAIAEAGINEAYSRLVSDFSIVEQPSAFALTEFEGGSYHVAPRPLTDRTAILTSTGRFGAAEARVAVDLRHVRSDDFYFGTPSPWSYAILSNGNLLFDGAPPVVRGGIHTNHGFIVSGNPENLEGTATVTAQWFDWSSGGLPEEQIGPWREVRFPQLTDSVFEELFETAKANDAVRSGGTYRGSELDGVSGNVVWFTGDVTLSGSFAFDGYVIVSGSLIFRGSGSRTLGGLLYVSGNLTSNGATALTLDGTLMVGGNLTYNGAAGVLTHGHSAPPGVDLVDEGEARVAIAVWRE